MKSAATSGHRKLVFHNVANVRLEVSRVARRLARKQDELEWRYRLCGHSIRDHAGATDDGSGFPILFRDAPVLLQSTIKSSWWHFGMLGMDKLAQASEVTLDFKAMRIDLK